MDKSRMQLPVFLPGNNRDWKQWDGVATITEEGEVHIRLVDEEATQRMIIMAKEGILLQLSFDYKMSDDLLHVINTQYREVFSKDEVLDNLDHASDDSVGETASNS